MMTRRAETINNSYPEGGHFNMALWHGKKKFPAARVENQKGLRYKNNIKITSNSLSGLKSEQTSTSGLPFTSHIHSRNKDFSQSSKRDSPWREDLWMICLMLTASV